jgi:uncharacterized protein YeaO (DUF488 family)
MIRIKRVYEPDSPADGARFLVERLWPRGMKKEALRMDGWLRDIAPSPELRKWYSHDPAKWPEFQRRYRRELDSHRKACRQLLEIAARGPLTLLYSARDPERNSALVLKAFLEKRTAAVRAPRPRRASRAAGRERKE